MAEEPNQENTLLTGGPFGPGNPVGPWGPLGPWGQRTGSLRAGLAAPTASPGPLSTAEPLPLGPPLHRFSAALATAKRRPGQGRGPGPQSGTGLRTYIPKVPATSKSPRPGPRGQGGHCPQAKA